MKWQRSGECGMVSEPYRVGKFFIKNQFSYGLWVGDERLGWFDSFEDCQLFAEAHAADGLAQVGEM